MPIKEINRNVSSVATFKNGCPLNMSNEIFTKIKGFFDKENSQWKIKEEISILPQHPSDTFALIQSRIFPVL